MVARDVTDSIWRGLRAPGGAAVVNALAAFAERLGAPEMLAQSAAPAAAVVVALAAAGLAAWAAAFFLKPARAALAERPSAPPDAGRAAAARHAALFAARAALVFAPPAAFFAAGGLAAAALGPVADAPGGLVRAVAAAWAVSVAARLVFAPPAGGRRLAPVGDRAGAALLALARRLAAVVIVGPALGGAALAAGLAPAAHAVWLQLVGLAAACVVAGTILRHRGLAAAALAGAPAAAPDGAQTDEAPGAGPRARLAGFWHLPALLYVAAAWGAWAAPGGDSGAGAFLARVVLTVAVLAAAAAVLALAHRAGALGAGRYAGAARLALAGGAAMTAAAVLAEIWVGGAFAFLAAGPGRAALGKAVSIAIVLLGALVLWEAVAAAIDRALARAGGARLRTLLPLARNAARMALAAVAALTVLSELGVDIAPLLAGAGIAGIAVGFGAQSLVKDVITGVFILLEDSMAVGDVVDVGGHSGTVEGLTVRTVRLRDLRGDLHIVPFGEIGSVRNMSRGFSYALIEAGVAYGEDVDRVVEALREIGDEMRADPAWGPAIIEPLDVLGLDSFGDSSVNLRVRLKTRPSRQWGVRREFHRRMKRAFDAAGIEIPFPHRTVIVARRAPPPPTDRKDGKDRKDEGGAGGAAGSEHAEEGNGS